MNKINRKTDSLLDWLGDWGGLLDSFHFLVELLVNSYQIYAIKNFLTNLLGQFYPEIDMKKDILWKGLKDKTDLEKREELSENIIANFS